MMALHGWASVECGGAATSYGRALATGNPGLVIPAAAELGRLSLADALAVVLVVRGDDAACFERAVVRWHSLAAQHACEAQTDAGRLQGVARIGGAAAGRLLAELCALYGLASVAKVLDGWLERA